MTAGLLAIAATAVAAGPAAAAAPAPTSCAGISFTDPKGDHALKPPLLNVAVPTQTQPANFDIHQGWFSFVDGKLTVNIQVENLSKTKSSASQADAMGYWVYYNVGEELRLAVAYTTGTNWVFKHGHDEDGFIFDGDTTGTAYEGPNGVMSIELPEGLHGETLTAPYALSAKMTLAKGDPIFGNDPILYETVDTAPDEEGGKDYTATPCAEAGVATPTTEAPKPTAEAPKPAQASSDSNEASKGAPAPLAAPAASAFTVTVPKLTAAKLKKGKRFSVGVLAAAPTKKLTVTLVKGGKVVAKGSLKSLTGKKSVKLKVSKKLAKGSYQLLVKGTDASGKAVSGAVAVTVA